MTQTKDFAERLGLSAGDKLIGLRGTGADSESLFDVSLFDTATPLNGARIGNYSPVRAFHNKLFVFCGDSTTRQLNANTGFFTHLLRAKANVNSLLFGAAGFVNYGMDGYTLYNFVNEAARPDFVGASADNPNWDYAGSNVTGHTTWVPMRDAVKITGDVYFIGHGINDCILTTNGRDRDLASLTDYLADLLRTAVEFFQTELPRSLIVLKMPNKMTARPYNQTDFPSDDIYPDFGDDVPTDEALVLKWNTALHDAYVTVVDEYPSTLLLHTHREIFWYIDETSNGEAANGLMTNLIHPSIHADRALAELFIADVSGRDNSNGRRQLSNDVYTAYSLTSPWEMDPTYFRTSPEYEPVIEGLLGSAIAADNFYFGRTTLEFASATANAKELFIEVVGHAAFRIGWWLLNPAGASVQLYSLTVPAYAQFTNTSGGRTPWIRIYRKRTFRSEEPIFASFGNADYNLNSTNKLGHFILECTAALTADRTVTLPSEGRVRVVRSVAATGVFNLLVKNSGGTTIATMASAATFIEVCWNGSAWRLIGSGAVDDTP